MKRRTASKKTSQSSTRKRVNQKTSRVKQQPKAMTKMLKQSTKKSQSDSSIPLLKKRVQHDANALIARSKDWEKEFLKTLHDFYGLAKAEFTVLKTYLQGLQKKGAKSFTKNKNMISDEIKAAKLALEVLKNKQNKIQAVKKHFKSMKSK